MPKKPSVSIIVPARDEAGNISEIIRRIPQLGSWTEVIFVEGYSTDQTWSVIRSCIQRSSLRKIRFRAVKQEKKKGKEAAIRKGFEIARGDILMILDADLSVDPEKLRDFYTAICGHQRRFVNGSRFIHPQEPLAMRYLNNIGNIFFAKVFSMILDMRVTDTLCGTKVLWRKDWIKLRSLVSAFATHDPYGDFELFLGAHLLGLEIVEVPVVYRARVYGKTKISRFRDGIHLLGVLGSFLLFLLRRSSHSFSLFQ